MPDVSDVVPDEVLPSGTLAPLKYRDFPEPASWTRMVGPGLMLAGLALGSGEFILWPKITFASGFVFFWACLLGVITQFYLNMEIERWTLVTGETALTGFCRLSRIWMPVMLLLNIIPWAWPGWATGAGQLLSWLIWGPIPGNEPGEPLTTAYVSTFGIAGLWLVGAVLTLGPVVYETVEKIQMILVSLVMVLVIVIACLVVRADAVWAMLEGVVSVGQMPDSAATGLSVSVLLGALAFAGAGGTTNLAQSNLVKDKGYGMGRFIGRITSPITGQTEAVASTGFFPRATRENEARWWQWWRAANIEHAMTFGLTCAICLMLMSLITYSLYYDADGTRVAIGDLYPSDMDFVWGEAQLLESQFANGQWLKVGFLVMGAIILLTTELGVLDATSRVSADLVKTSLLQESEHWSESQLYYVFLWAEILLGTVILLLPGLSQPGFLIATAAAMNGGVMFIYSVILLYMNSQVLPRPFKTGWFRFVILVWSCGFFGYFTLQALRMQVIPFLLGE